MKYKTMPGSKPCRQCGKLFAAADLLAPYNFPRQKLCSLACSYAARKFTPEKAAAVFWSRVDKTVPNGCWLFTGCRDKWGYGDIQFMRRHIQAHRLAWILLRGEPGKMDVLHKCNNPPCCNPRHLYLGTDFENAADRLTAGKYVRGSAMYNAKLTEEKVQEIRARRKATGESYEKIAADYGVNYSTIRYICRGETWTHVPTPLS